MVLDVTTWTAKVCETGSVLGKPVFHSPGALLFGLRRAHAAVLFCLVAGLMLKVEMLSASAHLPLSRWLTWFEHSWHTVELGSSKASAAAGFRYNGFRPSGAVDRQHLLADTHLPFHHVVAIRPLADQGTVLDEVELTVPSEPKRCGAQSDWADRQGMFPLKLTSWCGKLLASALSAPGANRTVLISLGAVFRPPLFSFDRFIDSQVKLGWSGSLQRRGGISDQVSIHCLEAELKSFFLRLKWFPQLVKIFWQTLGARMELTSSGRLPSVLHAYVPIALFNSELYERWSLHRAVAWFCWPTGHFRACITQELRCLPHFQPTPALVFAAMQPNIGCLH